MKRLKETKPFKPVATMEQMLAFDPQKPETYTRSELVNAVLEAYSHHEILASNRVGEYLELDAKYLSYALKVLTGHSLNDLRTELRVKLVRDQLRLHPGTCPAELVRLLGFSGVNSLWRYLERSKHRFPQMYREEQAVRGRRRPRP